MKGYKKIFLLILFLPLLFIVSCSEANDVNGGQTPPIENNGGQTPPIENNDGQTPPIENNDGQTPPIENNDGQTNHPSENIPLKEFEKVELHNADAQSYDGNLVFEYDGKAHSLEVKGNIPQGTIIEYVNNDKIDCGLYEVSATLKCEGYETKVITTTMIIRKKQLNFQFLNCEYIYDGTEKNITIVGELPEDVTVTYENNTLTNAGSVLAIAHITSTNPNYEFSETLEAYLTVKPAVIDTSGLKLEDKTYTYDGTDKELTLSGTIPEYVEVNYSYWNQFRDAGEYNISIHLSSTNDNYVLSNYELNGKLTINKVKIDLTNIKFNDAKHIYDGIQKELLISGQLHEKAYVSYQNNCLAEIGSTNATAIISTYDPINYEFVGNNIFNANLTITENINKDFEYILNEDGTAKITRYLGNDIMVAIPNIIDGKEVTLIDKNFIDLNERIKVIIVPKTIKYLEQGVFSNCTNLDFICCGLESAPTNWDNNWANNVSVRWCYEDEIRYTSNGLILQIRKYSNSASVIKCVSDSSNIDIPSHYNGLEVGDIGWHAFKDCHHLQTVTIPNGVTNITYAFEGCTSLVNVTIPNSVTYMLSAFEGCTSLVNVTIPNGVTDISHAFSGCTSLVNVTIPNGVTDITYAFNGCSSLSSVIIPDSVQDMNRTFEGCTNLISVNIPNGVTSIDSYTFRNCNSLTSITIPNSVTSIGDWAFSQCTSLRSIAIPSSATRIGDFAFDSCSSLTSITIPNSVTSIGDWAFRQCTSLRSVAIPSSVTSIRSSTFEGCSSLISINIPSSVTSIGGWAFSGCSSLKSIDIPSSVTSIGDFAFRQCTSLRSVAIPSSVTSIRSSTFEGCSSLISINIPSSVTSIGGWAFSGCSSLKSIDIPSSVTSIGEYAFSESTNLTSITIPSSVTSIGNYAFGNCENLKTIYCEVPSKPEGWNNIWCDENITKVIWGYKK